MDYSSAVSLVLAMSGSGQPSGLLQFLPFAIILAIFYFLILLPMQRRQKKVQFFQESLKVGDKVITTSGIYGHITRVNDRTVQLQIADKVRIDISRQNFQNFEASGTGAPIIVHERERIPLAHSNTRCGGGPAGTFVMSTPLIFETLSM